MATHLQVAHKGTRYSPLKESVGIVVAYDIRTDRELWRRQVYVVRTDADFDQSIDRYKIVDLWIEFGLLMVKNGNGDLYRINLETLEVSSVRGENVIYLRKVSGIGKSNTSSERRYNPFYEGEKANESVGYAFPKYIDSLLNSNSSPLSGARLVDLIGDSFDVKLGNGIQVRCSVVMIEKLNAFCKDKGIDWRKVISDNYGGYKAERLKNGTIKNLYLGAEPSEENNYEGNYCRGFLINLDLYQQCSLLRAIIEKCPEFKNSVGLFNLKASHTVYLKLNEVGFPQRNMYWFWTGEKYKGKEIFSYGESGLILVDSLKVGDIQNSRYCNRNIDHGNWYFSSPGYDGYFVNGVMVVGGLL